MSKMGHVIATCICFMFTYCSVLWYSGCITIRTTYCFIHFEFFFCHMKINIIFMILWSWRLKRINSFSIYSEKRNDSNKQFVFQKYFHKRKFLSIYSPSKYSPLIEIRNLKQYQQLTQNLLSYLPTVWHQLMHLNY